MFFSHRVILSTFLVIVCCTFTTFTKNAVVASNKQAAALVMASTLTAAARMSAESNIHGHSSLSCMPCVFAASLATMILADRLYNGQWCLLSSLLRSCGITVDYSAKKNGDDAADDINDDFADFESSEDTDNSSESTGDEAGGCCSGCCSC